MEERSGNRSRKCEASTTDTDGFYPRDAMLARVIEIATCCLSVRHAPVLCQNEES